MSPSDSIEIPEIREEIRQNTGTADDTIPNTEAPGPEKKDEHSFPHVSKIEILQFTLCTATGLTSIGTLLAGWAAEKEVRWGRAVIA